MPLAESTVTSAVELLWKKQKNVLAKKHSAVKQTPIKMDNNMKPLQTPEKDSVYILDYKHTIRSASIL